MGRKWGLVASVSAGRMNVTFMVTSTLLYAWHVERRRLGGGRIVQRGGPQSSFPPLSPYPRSPKPQV